MNDYSKSYQHLQRVKLNAHLRMAPFRVFSPRNTQSKAIASNGQTHNDCPLSDFNSKQAFGQRLPVTRQRTFRFFSDHWRFDHGLLFRL